MVELIFDGPIEDNLLDVTSKRLLKNYSTRKDVVEYELKLDLSPEGGQAPMTSQKRKFQLSSEDQTCVAVLGPVAIQFAQKAPYCGWTGFGGRIDRDLKIFFSDAPYRNLARIGMRYINRIDVPFTPTNITEETDYLKLGLVTPASLQPLARYKIEMAGALPGGQLFFSIRSESVISPLVAHSGFLLDIDVFCQNDLPNRQSLIMALLDEMNNQAHMIFEESITDKSRELFGVDSKHPV